MTRLKTCKRIWLISRHPAARVWVERQDIHLHDAHAHLDEMLFEQLRTGDCVIGNLPLFWAARLTEKGVRYFNLDLEVPAHLRGHELDLEGFKACSPRLTEYHVEKRL